MKTAEEILKETLNLKGEITEKDYWMTVSVKDCLKAINKALAITAVVKSLPSDIEVGKVMSGLSKIADKEAER